MACYPLTCGNANGFTKCACITHSGYPWVKGDKNEGEETERSRRAGDIEQEINPIHTQQKPSYKPSAPFVNPVFIVFFMCFSMLRPENQKYETVKPYLMQAALEGPT